MEILFDEGAGFCFGVNNAIKSVEDYLEENNNKTLYCLGEIVHNQAEVARLEHLGMKVIDHEDLKKLSDCTVLIRAHGEPPATYELAKERNISIIDATCPIVLKLQEKIKKAWNEMQKKEGNIVIYGKPDHAEVIGLRGQTQNKALILESEEDVDKIPVNKPLRVFSQTTKSKNEYLRLSKLIEDKRKNSDFIVKNTICGSVSNRVPKLQKFSKNCDVLIFVAGKNSSNGKALFNVCKTENPKSYLISIPDELNFDWFKDINTVGISGATSTPKWLMEEVIEAIRLKFQ
ncbi:MAG: 4-hydroxy-3-methylbut-2-enyl diphosphate reductase [Bacteroidales bacterium]